MRNVTLRQPPSGPFRNVEIPETSSDVENVSIVPGATVTAALNALAGGGAGVGVLSSVLYVDGGTAVPVPAQTGSIGAPFSTVQQALDEVAASSGERWQILVTPGAYVENLAVPEGKTIRIEGAGLGLTTLGDGASSHVWTQTGAHALGFDGLRLLGALEIADGAAPPAFQSWLVFQDADCQGSITASGAHVVSLAARATVSDANAVAVGNDGPVPVFEGGCSLVGDLLLESVRWDSLALACRNAQLSQAVISGGPFTLTGAQFQAVDTEIGGSVEFTGAPGVATFDRFSLSTLRRSGGEVFGGTLRALDFEWLSNTLYVDPTNPSAFGTIQDAIDSLAPGASARIVLRPFGTYTENLTIGSAVLEICTDVYGSRTSTVQGMPGMGAEIVGNITWTPSDDQGLMLRNVRVTGNAAISVGTGGGHGATLRLECVDWVGDIISSGPGWCNLIAKGWPPLVSTAQHRITGTVDMLGGPDGFLVAEHYTFTGALSAFSPSFYTCTFSSGCTITSSSTFVNMRNSVQAFGGLPITFSGAAGLILADEFTVATLLERIPVITNGELYTHGNFLGRSAALAADSGPNNIFINPPPRGLYSVSWSYEVTTAGTTGSAQPRLSYTGRRGAVTVDLGAPLDISGTGQVEGTYTFWSDGTANIAWSVAGIVTPGPLASVLDIVCENLNKRL